MPRSIEIANQITNVYIDIRTHRDHLRAIFNIRPTLFVMPLTIL